MNDLPPAPETEKTAVEAPVAEKPAATLPTSVLALGFIAITLVGVLIAMAIKSKPADGSVSAAKEGDDPALRDAKARIQLLQGSVNQERAKLGLSPMYGDSTQSAEVVASRITEDAATLVALSKGVKDLISNKDAELAQRTKEWTDAVKLQGVLRDQLAETKEQLNKALIEGSDTSALRSQLDLANKKVIALGDELRRLSDNPDKLMGQVAQLRSDRDALQARVAELESRLSQASLFAGTESQLMGDAVELFRSLRALENKPDSEIATAYSQFGAKMGASVMDRPISFPTGASDVAPEDLEKIKGFIGEAPDNAFIFVVGYASETGNVDSNRALSSDRATAVATIVNQAKKSGQRVQAAYLGQTDRFGSKFPERNQICEVWQIIPKN